MANESRDHSREKLEKGEKVKNTETFLPEDLVNNTNESKNKVK